MYLAKSTNWETLSRSNWNLEMLIFFRRGENWSIWRKTSQSKDKNQPQLNPHNYDTGCGNQIPAKLERGECFHHCTIPAPLIRTYLEFWTYTHAVASHLTLLFYHGVRSGIHLETKVKMRLSSYIYCKGSRDGAVVRALTSHQCGMG